MFKMVGSTLFTGVPTLLFVSLLVATTMAVQISISPSKISGLDDSPVNVTCSPDGSSSDQNIREVILIEMAKNGGKPIVLIRQNSLISYEQNININFQAEGHVSKNTSQSYLKVTFPSPDAQDSGEYSCVLYFLDHSGLLKEERTSKNLTVQSMKDVLDFLLQKVSLLDNLQDVITTVKQLENHSNSLSQHVNNLGHMNSLLMDKVTNLEKNGASNQSVDIDALGQDVATCLDRVTKLEQTTQNHSQQINSLDQIESLVLNRVTALEKTSLNHSLEVSALHSQESAILDKLDILTDANQKQEQKLQSLSSKVGPTPAFSATLFPQTTQYNNGDVITFPKVIMSQGQGYNATSGIFTAQEEGLYVFHLVLAMYHRCQGCEMQVEMRKNDTEVVAVLSSSFNSDQYTDRFTRIGPQTSLSALVYLEAGDDVRNVVVHHLRSATLDYHSHSSIFTGYKLRD